MNPRITAAAAAVLSLAVPSAFAQTVSTDPVGFIPVTAKGNSDTYVAVPLHRGAAFQGVLASVEGSTFTVTAASFAQDAFKDTHYVLVASGAKEGMWYAVTGTSGSTVTVDLAGDNPGTAIGQGTRVQIIPFWTLNTLFPEGAGVHPSATFLPKSRVLVPDHTRAGINLVAAATYFYYSGTQSNGEGWRKFGAAPTQLFDDAILLPDSHVIVRHEIAQDTVIQTPGAVQMTTLANVVGTLAAGKAQDNALSFNVAVPTSLAASRLFESGAFTGTDTVGEPVDQLLVFDNAVAQKNRQPSAIYYVFNGTGPSQEGRGWRRMGDLTTIQDGTLVFQPQFGYILRKAASAQAETAVWTARPAYLPQP